MAGSGWSWKAKNGGLPGLKYEPGNWGDILKSCWLVRVAAWLAEHLPADRFTYLDPFAGAPVYPVSGKTLPRLEAVRDLLPEGLYEYVLNSGSWPGSATIISDIFSNGNPEIHVFDADDSRRDALASCDSFNMLKVHSGYDVLKMESLFSDSGLILVDPYDFLADWRQVIDELVSASDRMSTLVYIYNRSARGESQLREYRDFRNRLEDLTPGRKVVVARVPADPFLPKAHHEMLFLPSQKAAAHGKYGTLHSELGEIAKGVFTSVNMMQAFEG